MVIGPNDPRACRKVGTWKDRYGKEHPVLRDGTGATFKGVSGSVKDMLAPDFVERLFAQLDDARQPDA